MRCFQLSLASDISLLGMSNAHIMDIDTTPPTAHHDNRPLMQLDLSSDDNMMDVDPEVCIPSPTTNPSQDVPPAISGSPAPSPSPFVANWIHNTPSREPGSSPTHHMPSPPVVTITSSNVVPAPTLKLDQLFVEWFIRPESQNWLRNVIDDPNVAKPTESSQVDFSPRTSRVDRSLSSGPHRSLNPPQGVAHASSPSGPGSPVSKHFWNHKPFGDLDPSSRSPPPTPSMDLEHSGTLSSVPVGNSSYSAIPSAVAVLGSGHTEPARPDGETFGSPLSELRPVLSVGLPEGSETVDGKNSQASSLVKEPTKAHQLELEGSQVVAADAALVTNQGRSLSRPDTSSKTSSGSEKCSSAHASEVIGVLGNTTVHGPSAADSSESAATGQSHAGHVPTSANDTLSKSTSNKILSHDSRENQQSSAAIPPKSSPGSVSSERSQATVYKAIPDFYFPCGKDAQYREQKERDSMREYFKAQRTRSNKMGLARNELAELVVEVMGLPSYLSSIVFSLVLELFPQNGSDSSNNTCGDLSDSNIRRGNEETMRDVAGGGEMSSSSSVNSGARALNGGGGWQGDADTAMVDSKGAKDESDRMNGLKEACSGQPGGGNEMPGLETEKSSELVSEAQMMAFYNARCAGQSREARLFYTLLGSTTDRDYLIPNDFKPLMRSLLLNHQGLAFLHVTPEFQQRYSETVIERIYFGCTRQHNGRLSLADLKRSKLLETLLIVDEEEDINRERRFFSYEHFYVLYCRFWELDVNHDLQIGKDDLLRYGSHSLTTRIVNRIFSGHARPLDASENGDYMSYTDFIWFCLSEEDKTSDTAIDYWFRCIDLDGDGIVTMYDMEFFYREQLHRMESFGHEPVQIKDILCQLLDMINPNMHPPIIRRRDLKRCGLAGNFFNVLFNLNKFFAIEARDPLQIRQEHATPELTDWDRFAALEYLRLSADEEGEEEESWEEVGEPANPLMSGEAPF